MLSGESKTSKYAIVGILLVIGIVLIGVWYIQTSPQQVPAERFIISSGSPEYSALTIVAEEKGYFKQQGLNVTIRDFPTGAGAINDLLAGKADLAYAAEFVGVAMIDKNPDFMIIGSTAKSNLISIVVRKDSGISSPGDLKGKTIAFPKGTQAEFFLGRYLTLNSLDISDVSIQYLQPEDLVQSIVSGKSDAVIIWEPHVFNIRQQLGDNGKVFPAQSGQRFYWLTYTRPEVIRTRSDLLVRYFRALKEAESYLLHNNDDSKEIVRQRVNLSNEYIDSLWENNQYILSLDQSLIIAMEDEYRWVISENLTDKKAVPNFLDYINTSFLYSVKPDSVNIIL